MVYAIAARKTASFMLLSMVISLAIVMLISENFGAPTGRVVSDTTAPQSTSIWMIFLLGLFVGALAVGAYAYVTHLEAKRKE